MAFILNKAEHTVGDRRELTKDYLVDLIKQGLTDAKIGQIFGMSNTTVYKDCYFDFINQVKQFISSFYCFDYKIDTTIVKDIIYNNYKEGVLNLWKTGLYTKTRIAKELGCSRQTVKNWTRRFNCE